MFEKQKLQTNILVIFMTSDPCLGHPYWHLPCHSQWRGYLCLPMSPPPLLPPDEITNSISYGPIISRESLRSSLLCCCLPHPHQQNHLQNFHHQLVQPEKDNFWQFEHYQVTYLFRALQAGWWLKGSKSGSLFRVSRKWGHLKIENGSQTHMIWKPKIINISYTSLISCSITVFNIWVLNVSSLDKINKYR